MTKSALVVFSGGQDSTTCLFLALLAYDTVHLLTFDYGQRHAVEIEAAKSIAQLAGVASHEVLNLGADILQSASPLVSDNELEQYEDHASLPDGIEKTFVPMRNQLFLTIAYNRAIAMDCEVIYTGVCQEDSGGYPDCRQSFITALSHASHEAVDGAASAVDISTPLMHLTKAESVLLAVNTPGAYEALAYSHTSYDGQYPPTGSDHATLLRAKGFEVANVPDPLVLRAVRNGLMPLPNTPNYENAHIEQYLLLAKLT